MPRQQLNIQLDDETRDVLEAAVFVRDLRSMQELLRPTLRDLATTLNKDRRIRDAIELRSAQRGGKPGAVKTRRPGKRSP